MVLRTKPCSMKELWMVKLVDMTDLANLETLEIPKTLKEDIENISDLQASFQIFIWAFVVLIH